ncbi:hypothetical protein Tco_0059872 [Tanacetum coccineum]
MEWRGRLGAATLGSPGAGSSAINLPLEPISSLRVVLLCPNFKNSDVPVEANPLQLFHVDVSSMDLEEDPTSKIRLYMGLNTKTSSKHEWPSGNPFSSKASKWGCKCSLVNYKVAPEGKGVGRQRESNDSFVKLDRSNGRLIAEEPTPGDPEYVDTSTPTSVSIFELYDRSVYKIQHGEFERSIKVDSHIILNSLLDAASITAAHIRVNAA